MAITDASGRLLWVEGNSRVLSQAEDMHFVEGALWDEDHAGTNAPGTALAVDHAVQIFAAEHFSRQVQPWTCSAAPIHDPVSGAILGAIDVTGGDNLAVPVGLALVQAAARAVEVELARLGRASAALVDGEGRPMRSGLTVTCLGASRLVEDGSRLTLPPRQIEILVLLALEHRGMSPERLREALYGDRYVAPATLKAEVSHLRRALHGAVSTRCYELTVPIRCDAVQVLDALRGGDLDQALNAYQGPLLPESEAPGIIVWRNHLEVALREAVLRARRPEPALRYGDLHPEDYQVFERALTLLAPDDPRRGIALDRYRTALG